uniref:Uncharacterized protein n=1 Tax=Oryza brachyantha TaxID=4533 RepID=J3L885_ORYBR
MVLQGERKVSDSEMPDFTGTAAAGQPERAEADGNVATGHSSPASDPYKLATSHVLNPRKLEPPQLGQRLIGSIYIRPSVGLPWIGSSSIGVTEEDSLAHLSTPSPTTCSVRPAAQLGVSASMPVMGGAPSYVASDIFAADCAVARFGRRAGISMHGHRQGQLKCVAFKASASI